MEWVYDGKPSNPGWYAVLVCYETHEGASPMGAWWDGDKWHQEEVIAFGGARLTKQAAEELAYKHDPDDPDTQRGA